MPDGRPCPSRAGEAQDAVASAQIASDPEAVGTDKEKDGKSAETVPAEKTGFFGQVII